MFTISDCAISVDTWSMNAFLALVVGHVFLVSSDAVVATTSAPDPAATPDPGTSACIESSATTCSAPTGCCSLRTNSLRPCAVVARAGDSSGP
jgi:hypothetical protein